MRYRRWLGCGLPVVACILVAAWPSSTPGYIGGPPATLGMMFHWSTHVMTVKVERVDREKGVIIFRKLVDLKGKWPTDVVRQAIPAGLPERQRILEWAEPGKSTVMFALESYRWSHTYIDSLWYAANTADWQLWTVSHGEPILLRTFSGKPDRLIGVAGTILAGHEVIVPCLADGSLEDLRLKRTKVQRQRASLKLLEYNARRDFVAWGGDDFDRIAGMPGFTHRSSLGRVDEPQGISCVDIDGDGRLDLCLVGAGKVLILQNQGDYWNEVTLPGVTGSRAAVWADCNGDGRPDLLLATTTGPKLLTNLGGLAFRDDTALLPRETGYNLTAAAWIDFDGDGRPDILLGNGFHGLRLYRNRGRGEPFFAGAANPAAPPPAWLPFEDVSVAAGLGPDGGGSSVKGDALAVCDVDGDGRPDFLYGAGAGMLFLNTPDGFVEVRNSGISCKPGKVGPVFGDFDNRGHPGLFVPQLDGSCKLFRNDGKGRFTDITAQAGDLARPIGMATSAAWGDFDNDGRLDLVVGCLQGPNRYFRNLGDGRFEDASEAVGLLQRICNTQAVALVDLNNDGMLDLVFNNEGQESLALLGNLAWAGRRTPVALHLSGPLGVVGSRVRLFDKDGQLVASQFIAGSAGRGGQNPPIARFSLEPGDYRAAVRFTSGVEQVKLIRVGIDPLKTLLDDRMMKAE